MVESNTSICNKALSHIGSGTISSLSENTPLASKCNLWYDHCRKLALEHADWSFARKRIALTTHGDDAPDDRWLYRYRFPSDALKIRWLQNPYGTKANNIPYKIEVAETSNEKTIVTDLDDAVVVYTMDLIETEKFPTYFVDALSHLIASYLAPPITGRHKSIKEVEFQIYWNMINFAAAHDANEEQEDQPRDADWIRGRSVTTLEIETPVLRNTDA